MDSSGTGTKQSILTPNNGFIAHENDTKHMLRPLHPELENGLLSNLPPIKPKLTQSPPSTPCRTPITLLPEVTTILASPLSLSGVTTSCSPSQNSRNHVDSASIHASTPMTESIGIRTADAKDQHLFNATGETKESGMTGQQEEMPGDLPPIAFLHEPSASPTVPTRRLPTHKPSPPVSRGSSGTIGADAQSNGFHQFQVVPGAPVLAPQAPVGSGFIDQLPPSVPVPVAVTQTRAPSTASASTSRHTSAFPVAPSSRPSSVPRHSHAPASRDASARTRAGTGASAHERAPRYKYTYNSLMRRTSAIEQQPEHGVTRTGQQELEATCGTARAPVGMLRGPPVCDIASIAAFLEAMRGGGGDGMDVDVDSAAAERWVRPCANTAPTAAYVALLEDAFGPGSVLRGEGPKPLGSLRPRKVLGKGKGRGRSTTTERSTSSEGDMDVDTDANVDVATGRSRRAPGWIAEIQTVVKGKRQLAREDVQSLLNTLREIADMSAVEGQALGDDAARLRKSLWELAQLKDLPFRDEFQVRGWARRILKSWPA